MIPKLSNTQLKQLAEFTSNLGLVFLASVITPLFSNIDRVDIFNVLLGLSLGLIALAISLLLVRNVKQ